MRAYRINDNIDQEVSWFDLSLFLNDNGRLEHIGVLFNEGLGETTKYIHLAGHYQLRVDDPDASSVGLKALFHDEERELIAAKCMEIEEENRSREVAYAINYEPNIQYFDDVGRYLPKEAGKGLTCATFVLNILKNLGYELFDFEDWQTDQEDIDAQTNLVGYLRRWGATEEHIAANENDIECRRVRPLDVATVVGVLPKHQCPYTQAKVRDTSEPLLVHVISVRNG